MGPMIRRRSFLVIALAVLAAFTSVAQASVLYEQTFLTPGAI